MASVITGATSTISRRADPWLVSTYAVSNRESQRLTASLLERFADVHVRTTERGGRPLIIVECQGSTRAQALHDVILTTDWAARLVDATQLSAVPLTA